MKNKILMFSLVIILIIISIIVYITYINRIFTLSQHNLVKQILNISVDNYDIYIETIYPKQKYKLSENDKTNFIYSLKDMKVKKDDNIINGVSRKFIIENKKNNKKITINIANSMIDVGENTYRIINENKNIFEEIYYKYTGKNYN